MPSIAVVFPSYRIPEHRLRDHFEWNSQLYIGSGAKVFVVSDREYDVPDYATCVIFPEEKLPIRKKRQVFATTRLRNMGIRTAIESGCDVVICTDVDICFESEAWESLLAVADGVASIPYCRMSYADNMVRRKDKWIPADLATGTVSMTAANWGKVQYCEDQVAYGCDDGRLQMGIEEAGICEDRTGHIYHIAHVDGVEQKEFRGRCDHWNRENGFNPENFRGNCRK